MFMHKLECCYFGNTLFLIVLYLVPISLITIAAFFKLVVASAVKFMPLFLMAHPRVAGSN